MFFSKRTAKGNATVTHRSLGLSANNGFGDTWEKPAPAPTDWKKVLLLTGLGLLSWISTYTGMLELIQANMGEIELTFKIAIGFAVAMLMLMIVWLLDQLFDRLQPVVRLLFVAGYLFLTLISVGFGFGFYWKFLESRSEATRSAESAVTQVQTALLAAQTRLEQLNATFVQLTKISTQKAIDEREKGNSCPASRPGDGPRRRLRDADASKFGFAQRFIGERATSVTQDINALNIDLQKVVSRDKGTFDVKTGTRNVFLQGLGRKLNNSVTRFNAFRTDPQLRQFRSDFADRSGKSTFDNGRGGTFSCPDPELQQALRGVVRAIDQLPELEKPVVKAVEGSEAIIEAFRRLTTTISGLATLQVPPTPDELRAAQQRAVQSVRNDNRAQRRIASMQAGLGERDYIPLFIALFVDFCLLLVSVSRPMKGFQWLEHKMGSAQDGPVIKILSRFRDIHQDEEIRDVFEVFRHVVFDVRGVYYAAIPMNGTDPTSTSDLEPGTATEAQLLANLFTSFENDKVYKRVVAPLFTTGYIQKKLCNQGSKFHEAEAFRLYRFEKDQWQDWMLSAMMGAAKRVEARKNREVELFGADAPALQANPEPLEESTAPTLDEVPGDVPETTEEESAEDIAALKAFEKEIASEIEETLFNQTYERQEAVRKRELELDAKVHVLHAKTPRTPEHIIAQHAGTPDPEPAVVNAAYVPTPTQATDSALVAETAQPIPAQATVPMARQQHVHAQPAPAAPIPPVPVTTQKFVSLAERANAAMTAHTTGQHKPVQSELPSEAPKEIEAPAASTQSPISVSSNRPVQEEKKMPAIQVHDALPKNLRVMPVSPVTLANAARHQGESGMSQAQRATSARPHAAPAQSTPQPRHVQPTPRPEPRPAAANDQYAHMPATPASQRRPIVVQSSAHAPVQAQTRDKAPISVAPTPPQPQQLSLLDEPTDLPTILNKPANGASKLDPRPTPKVRSFAKNDSAERREPEFGNPSSAMTTDLDDDMIDNITSWYGRGTGSKKRQ